MEYAIFDMDGTLIDSMPAWHRLGEDYLRAKGIVPPEDLHEQIKAMTMLECGEYARALGVPGTAAQIADELTAQIERQYRELIPAREGVKEYLSRCRSAGVRMCVATATDSALANQCLARLGLLGYFEFLVSCEDIECVVFEDVLYPAETAARAGFPVAGVYDPASGEGNAQSLRAFCGAFIEDWRTAAFPPL